MSLLTSGKAEETAMGRYESLTRYLESRHTSEAPLTFKEVERILNRSLPASARLHQPWWANTTTHSHADAWMRAGWKTTRVDIPRERVVFVRGDSPAPPERTANKPTIAATENDEFVIRMERLAPTARALLLRHAAEQACSLEQAVSDLLAQADLDRRRRLLERFPLTGERSGVDSADLIREERDAR
jgi:hypothetical protein